MNFIVTLFQLMLTCSIFQPAMMVGVEHEVNYENFTSLEILGLAFSGTKERLVFYNERKGKAMDRRFKQDCMVWKIPASVLADGVERRLKGHLTLLVEWAVKPRVVHSGMCFRGVNMDSFHMSWELVSLYIDDRSQVCGNMLPVVSSEDEVYERCEAIADLEAHFCFVDSSRVRHRLSVSVCDMCSIGKYLRLCVLSCLIQQVETRDLAETAYPFFVVGACVFTVCFCITALIIKIIIDSCLKTSESVSKHFIDVSGNAVQNMACSAENAVRHYSTAVVAREKMRFFGHLAQVGGQIVTNSPYGYESYQPQGVLGDGIRSTFKRLIVAVGSISLLAHLVGFDQVAKVAKQSGDYLRDYTKLGHLADAFEAWWKGEDYELPKDVHRDPPNDEKSKQAEFRNDDEDYTRMSYTYQCQVNKCNECLGYVAKSLFAVYSQMQTDGAWDPAYADCVETPAQRIAFVKKYAAVLEKNRCYCFGNNNIHTKEKPAPRFNEKDKAPGECACRSDRFNECYREAVVDGVLYRQHQIEEFDTLTGRWCATVNGRLVHSRDGVAACFRKPAVKIPTVEPAYMMEVLGFLRSDIGVKLVAEYQRIITRHQQARVFFGKSPWVVEEEALHGIFCDQLVTLMVSQGMRPYKANVSRAKVYEKLSKRLLSLFARAPIDVHYAALGSYAAFCANFTNVCTVGLLTAVREEQMEQCRTALYAHPDRIVTFWNDNEFQKNLACLEELIPDDFKRTYNDNEGKAGIGKNKDDSIDDPWKTWVSHDLWVRGGPTMNVDDFDHLDIGHKFLVMYVSICLRPCGRNPIAANYFFKEFDYTKPYSQIVEGKAEAQAIDAGWTLFGLSFIVSSMVSAFRQAREEDVWSAECDHCITIGTFEITDDAVNPQEVKDSEGMTNVVVHHYPLAMTPQHIMAFLRAKYRPLTDRMDVLRAGGIVYCIRNKKTGTIALYELDARDAEMLFLQLTTEQRAMESHKAYQVCDVCRAMPLSYSEKEKSVDRFCQVTAPKIEFWLGWFSMAVGAYLYFRKPKTPTPIPEARKKKRQFSTNVKERQVYDAEGDDYLDDDDEDNPYIEDWYGAGENDGVFARKGGRRRRREAKTSSKLSVAVPVATLAALTALKNVMDSRKRKESLLTNNQFNVKVPQARTFGFFIDNVFVCNATVLGNKVFVVKHGLELLKEGSSVEIRRPGMEVTLRPQYVQIADDLVVFLFPSVIDSNRLPIRPPKEVEEAGISPLNDQLHYKVSIGPIAKNGSALYDSVVGDCTAPVISLEDGAVIGFHVAGGTKVNWFIPVDQKIIQAVQSNFVNMPGGGFRLAPLRH